MSPESKAGHWTVFLIKAACAVIVFFAGSFTLFTVGPELETRYWPVVSKLDVLTLEADANGQAIVTAKFTKHRDCEYIGIAWFKGSVDKSFERVPVILLRREGDTSSPNRPVGTQKVGPWIIGMTPAELRANSFAQLTHRCHPFWMTTTDFYP